MSATAVAVRKSFTMRMSGAKIAFNSFRDVGADRPCWMVAVAAGLGHRELVAA